MSAPQAKPTYHSFLLKALLRWLWPKSFLQNVYTAITTNVAALSFFVPHGYIMWAWAIPLAAANLCGGFTGTRIALKGGTQFLRYGFMVLLVILIGKFAWDLLPLLQAT